MTQHITIFGINLTIDPIAFTIPIGGGWKVHWYGIIIALGFMLAIIYGIKNAKRFNVDPDRMLDVIIVTTPVSIICARAFYVIFHGDKISSIKDFFGFSSGDGFSGIAIYGAVIGAFACGAVMCIIKKIKILDMFDLAAVAFLIGQGIGRWGNFTNQEAFGCPTGSDWFGMTSENVVKNFIENGYNPTALAHPCFLYESIWCIAGFFVLNHFSKKRHFSGEITLLYCIWYGFERSIVENLRTDSLPIGSFRISVVISIVLFVGASIALFVIRKKQKTAITDQDYVTLFEEDDDGLPAVDSEEISAEEKENE